MMQTVFHLLLLASLTLFEHCKKIEVTAANKSVLMVCYSNYIRSAIAEAVFKKIVKQKGLESAWYCDSAGISVYPEFDMDSRAKAVLRSHGIEPRNTPRDLTMEDFFKFDYIFGTDKINMAELNLKQPVGSTARIELLTSYDPLGTSMIRDPYYDDDSIGFEECYQIAYRSCNAFLDSFIKSTDRIMNNSRS